MNFSLKNIVGSISILLVLTLFGFVFDRFSSSENIKMVSNSNLAAIPASWTIERIAQEINKRENIVKNMWDRGNQDKLLAGKVGEFNAHMRALNQLNKRYAELKGLSTSQFDNFDLNNSILKSAQTYGVSTPDGLSPTETPWAEQIHHTGTPWGGLAVGPKIPCTCENPKNYMIGVNDYVSKGSVFIKYEDMKSKAYLYYDLNIGQYGLGTLDLGGTCSFRVGIDCIDYPVYGIINSGPGFGTSGFGGLSFPSILGDGAGQNFMDGGTFPATYSF